MPYLAYKPILPITCKPFAGIIAPSFQPKGFVELNWVIKVSGNARMIGFFQEILTGSISMGRTAKETVGLN